MFGVCWGLVFGVCFGLFGVGVWCLLQSVRQHGTPMRDMRTVMMNDADDDDADYVVPRVL